MISVGVLCEGQTEEIMVNEFLQPALLEHGVCLIPTILLTRQAAGGPSGRGGVSKWARIEKDLRHRLSSSPHWEAVTTLLDFYGLPSDSPGMSDRPTGPGSGPRAVEHVERALAKHIGHPRFLPHLVLHETETWVFAAAEQLGDLIGDVSVTEVLRKQAQASGGPELVNDGPDSAPSKRLLRAYPAYNKTQDGPMVVEDLGLPALRAACPHFDAWVSSLLRLAEAG